MLMCILALVCDVGGGTIVMWDVTFQHHQHRSGGLLQQPTLDFFLEYTDRHLITDFHTDRLQLKREKMLIKKASWLIKKLLTK